MEITIVKEDEYCYTVNIGGKRIEATATDSNDIVVQWLRQIKRLYFNNNNKQQNRNKLVVVGLCADRPQTRYTYVERTERNALRHATTLHWLALPRLLRDRLRFQVPSSLN